MEIYFVNFFQCELKKAFSSTLNSSRPRLFSLKCTYISILDANFKIFTFLMPIISRTHAINLITVKTTFSAKNAMTPARNTAIFTNLLF